MNGRPAYGTDVDADEVSAALEPARVLRLALNVLWDGLPDRVSRGPAREALEAVCRHLNEVEEAALRRSGLAGYYLIVRPVSLVSPPPPETMERIADAVSTLAGLGMLVGQHDAGYRE